MNQSAGQSEDFSAVQIAQVYLVPLTILCAGLGVSGTEWIKLYLSLLGVLVSLLWLISHLVALRADASLQLKLLVILPVAFLAGAAVSASVHGQEVLRRSRQQQSARDSRHTNSTKETQVHVAQETEVDGNEVPPFPEPPRPPTVANSVRDDPPQVRFMIGEEVRKKALRDASQR